MQANRILLQRKYSRIIEMFARSANIPLEQGMDKLKRTLRKEDFYG